MGHYLSEMGLNPIKTQVAKEREERCVKDLKQLNKILRSVPKGCIITRMKIREAILWRKEEEYEF